MPAQFRANVSDKPLAPFKQSRRLVINRASERERGG